MDGGGLNRLGMDRIPGGMDRIPGGMGPLNILCTNCYHSSRSQHLQVMLIVITGVRDLLSLLSSENLSLNEILPTTSY